MGSIPSASRFSQSSREASGSKPWRKYLLLVIGLLRQLLDLHLELVAEVERELAPQAPAAAAKG